MRKLIESKLSTKARNSLDSKEFGIPSKRAYPLNDKNHVLSAIRLFNYVDKGHEKELANNIIKAIKRYHLDGVNVSTNISRSLRLL